MAIPFYGSPGDCFNRIGKAGAVLVNAYNNQQTQLTALTNTTTGVVAQYDAESDLQAQVGASYIGILNSIGAATGPTMAGLIQTTLNRMVFRDLSQLNQNLTSVNLQASLKEIVRQMNQQGVTIQSSTVTATVTQFAAYASVGNGVLVVSTRREDGLTQENSYAEVLTATCTQDSYLGGATEGNEGFTITGEGNQPNIFAFDWPLGSNSSVTYSAIDGNSDNSAGNILTNSGFNDWTGSLPTATLDNWTLALGTYGTTIIENQSIVFDGDASVELIGDGATLVSFYQDFDSSSGTAGTLSPLSQYAVNLWLRRDGTPAAAGVLQVELVDQNNNAVTDASGNANTFTVNLTALTTSFVAYSGTFRTPQVEPTAGYRIRLRLTTAITTGRSVYLDKLGLGLTTAQYLSGPATAVFAGSTPFVQANGDDPGPPTRGDIASAVITNTLGGASTPFGNMQTLIAAATGSAQMNLLLPSSAVPSVPNSVIT